MSEIQQKIVFKDIHIVNKVQQNYSWLLFIDQNGQLWCTHNKDQQDGSWSREATLVDNGLKVDQLEVHEAGGDRIVACLTGDRKFGTLREGENQANWNIEYLSYSVSKLRYKNIRFETMNGASDDHVSAIFYGETYIGETEMFELQSSRSSGFLEWVETPGQDTSPTPALYSLAKGNSSEYRVIKNESLNSGGLEVPHDNFQVICEDNGPKPVLLSTSGGDTIMIWKGTDHELNISTLRCDKLGEKFLKPVFPIFEKKIKHFTATWSSSFCYVFYTLESGDQARLWCLRRAIDSDVWQQPIDAYGISVDSNTSLMHAVCTDDKIYLTVSANNQVLDYISSDFGLNWTFVSKLEVPSNFTIVSLASVDYEIYMLLSSHMLYTKRIGAGSWTDRTDKLPNVLKNNEIQLCSYQNTLYVKVSNLPSIYYSTPSTDMTEYTHGELSRQHFIRVNWHTKKCEASQEVFPDNTTNKSFSSISVKSERKNIATIRPQTLRRKAIEQEKRDWRDDRGVWVHYYLERNVWEDDSSNHSAILTRLVKQKTMLISLLLEKNQEDNSTLRFLTYSSLTRKFTSSQIQISSSISQVLDFKAIVSDEEGDKLHLVVVCKGNSTTEFLHIECNNVSSTTAQQEWKIASTYADQKQYAMNSLQVGLRTNNIDNTRSIYALYLQQEKNQLCALTFNTNGKIFWSLTGYQIREPVHCSFHQTSVSMITMDDQGKFQLLNQDLDSMTWHMQPLISHIHKDHKDSYSKVRCYRVEISVEQDPRQKNIDVTKPPSVVVRFDHPVVARVNGVLYLFDHVNNLSHSSSLNAQGKITVEIPAESLRCPDFWIKIGDQDEEKISPQSKSFATIKNDIKDRDSLLNATNKESGDRLISPTNPVKDNHDQLDAAAKLIAQHFNDDENQLQAYHGKKIKIVAHHYDLRTGLYKKQDVTTTVLHSESGSDHPTQLGSWIDDFIKDVVDDIGNVFSAIANTVVDVVNVVVHAIEDVVEETIKIVKSTITYIYEGIEYTVSAIVKGVSQLISWGEAIFNYVKVAFQDLYKWLCFFFKWDDIIATKDVFKMVINTTKDRFLRSILSENVKKDLRNKVYEFLGTFDEDLAKAAQQGTPSALADLDNKGTNVDDPEQQKIKERTDHNFIFDAISNSSAKNSSTPGKKDDVDPQPDFLTNLQKSIQDLISGLKDFSFQNLWESLTKKNAFFKNLVIPFIDGLIDEIWSLLTGLIEVFDTTLTKTFEIPLVSSLYEYIAGSPPSLLDILCLCLAIPGTLIYKLIYNKAPFTSFNDFKNETSGYFGTLQASNGKPEGLKQLSISEEARKAYEGIAYATNILYWISTLWGDIRLVVPTQNMAEKLALSVVPLGCWALNAVFSAMAAEHPFDSMTRGLNIFGFVWLLTDCFFVWQSFKGFDELVEPRSHWQKRQCILDGICGVALMVYYITTDQGSDVPWSLISVSSLLKWFIDIQNAEAVEAVVVVWAFALLVDISAGVGYLFAKHPK